MALQAQNLVLDRIESAFHELTADPYGVALSGTALGAWLPVPELGLHEMRDYLLDPPHPDAVPSIWKELVARFRNGDQPARWTLVALGAMAPGMRGICRRTQVHPSQQADLQAELVTQVLESLATLTPAHPRPMGELYWAARRARSRFQRSLIESEQRLLPLDAVPDQQTRPPGGHPDVALARLSAAGVITDGDADLIGRTRLESEPLDAAAARLGITYAACRKRRRRAERRIVEHYVTTGVLTAEKARRLLDGGLLSAVTPASTRPAHSTAVA